MITENQVIEAYVKMLRLKVRRMKIENERFETDVEFNERLGATEKFLTIELQYESQFVR